MQWTTLYSRTTSATPTHAATGGRGEERGGGQSVKINEFEIFAAARLQEQGTRLLGEERMMNEFVEEPAPQFACLAVCRVFLVAAWYVGLSMLFVLYTLVGK